ncbi:hypothetical protein DBR42_04715 [Pelomonas sp. HMWF004]|nr:hypothetical protein DBR42_04715 [Pelomonas sp. HMWF004]
MLNLNLEYVRARTFYIVCGLFLAITLAEGGGAAYFFIRHVAVVADLQTKISAQDATIRDLKPKADRAEGLAGLEVKLKTCMDGNRDMEDKVQAFAKQAASCDAIKQKFHYK